MLEEKFDFVIILNGLSTNFKDGLQNELIELNWCSYDLKKKSVTSETGSLIRPIHLKEIDSKYLIEQNINISQLENAEDLLEVLKKFNLFIFETFISKNLSFAFIIKDDWLLGRNGQLVVECKSKNIKLGYHFTKYFHLINEFKNFYKVDNLDEAPSLISILKFYSLKQNEMDREILQELNTLVRIVNRMVKEGYDFNMKRLVSVEDKLENEENFNEEKKQSESGAHVINSTCWKKIASFYFRIKNLPNFFEKKDIQNIFYLFNLLDDEIAVSYDIFGRKTGEFCVRVHDESNFKQILNCFNYRLIKNDKLIEIVSSSENDFNNALKSSNFIKFNLKSKIFIKVKNIPYSAIKEDSIRQFFKNYILAENGIKFLKNKKGNFLGEAVVAFHSEEEAGRAIKEKNGEQLMNQYLSLELTSIDEFENFANTNSFSRTIKNLCEYVSSEIVTKSLFINGLPLDITKEFFLKQMEMFNLNESNMIVDETNFSNYGCLILSLSNEDDANTIKNYINKITIKWKDREKKLTADNLLLLVNRGNEI